MQIPDLALLDLLPVALLTLVVLVEEVCELVDQTLSGLAPKDLSEFVCREEVPVVLERLQSLIDVGLLHLEALLQHEGDIVLKVVNLLGVGCLEILIEVFILA